MSISKAASPRQINLDMLPGSWEEIDRKEIVVKKPHLFNRPSKAQSADVRTDLNRMRMSNLEDSSLEESESEIVQVTASDENSELSGNVESPDKRCVVVTTAKSNRAQDNNAVIQSVELYCSAPNIRARCAASVFVTAATTALGVLVVMTTAGDDSVGNKAAWIAASVMGGVAISTVAGMFHFVCTLHQQPRAVVAPPA